MTNDENTAAAIALGREKADEILARRKIARAHRASVLAVHPGRLELTVQVASAPGPVLAARIQTAGFLVAAGDSWFANTPRRGGRLGSLHQLHVDLFLVLADNLE